MTFNADEARVLRENDILIMPSWHLPHGWHISAAGYTVPPLPEGNALDDLIDRCWQMLPPSERDMPKCVSRRRIWLPRLQQERQEELGEFAGPYAGRFNLIVRRAYWQNRDIDDVLREHGYVYAARRPIPPDRRGARSVPIPTRSATWSSSSDGRSPERSAPYLHRRDDPPPPESSSGTLPQDLCRCRRTR
jgi:hypothetical protein